MSRAEFPSQAAAAPRRVAAPVRRRFAIRLAAAAVGAGVAVALAGCGAGQVSQTAQQKSVVNGASAEVGDIALRDAQLAGPHNAGYYYSYGSNAPLVLSIVNSGSQDDRLVSVTSSLAKRVTVTGDRQLPGGSTLRIGAGLLSGDESAAAVPTGIGNAGITLVGLQVDKLRPGKEVPVTFSFAKAGKVTLNLPVATPMSEQHKAATESPSVSD